MTNQEFSNGFDALIDSYRRFKAYDKQEMLDSIEFNEYEKSIFLTMAQEELIVSLYNGKNPFGDSFEATEELRRYLDGLVKTKEYDISDSISGTKLTDKSVLFKLDDDVAFITLEQVTYSDPSLGCSDGMKADVYPVTQDEYSRVKDNPFRGPTKYKVLRMDAGNNVIELIPKFTISTYLIKYLSKPSPIVLIDLPDGLSVDGETEYRECTLNSILHDNILRRAVDMALATLNIKNRD